MRAPQARSTADIVSTSYIDELLNEMQLFTTISTLVSTTYVVLFLVLAIRRAMMRHLVEPNEGIPLFHIDRLLARKKLYVAPTVDFIPLLYGPSYYYIAMLFVPFFGNTLQMLRVTSITATVGSLLSIGALARSIDRTSWVGPVTAAGTFAATFPLTFFYMDIGRVDATFTSLILATIYLLFQGKSWVAQCICSFLGVAAILTKQTAAVVFGPLLIAVLFSGVLEKIPLLASGAVFLVAAIVLIYRLSSGRWPLYYLLEVPRGHPFRRIHRPSELPKGYLKHILSLGRMSVAIAAAIWLHAVDIAGNEGVERFWPPLILATTAAVGVMGTLKKGGDVNSMMPFLGILSAQFGQAVSRLNLRPLWRQASLSLPSLGSILSLAQSAALVYNPRIPIWLAQSYEPKEALAELLIKTDGNLLVLHHYGYLCRDVDPERVHVPPPHSWSDLVGEVEAKFRADLRKDLSSGRFDALICDQMFHRHAVEFLEGIPSEVTKLDLGVRPAVAFNATTTYVFDLSATKKSSSDA